MNNLEILFDALKSNDYDKFDKCMKTLDDTISEYRTLQEKLQLSTKEVSSKADYVNQLETELKQYKTKEESNTDKNYIRSLEQRLANIEASKTVNSTEVAELPIIDESFSKPSKEFIVIRECKTAIYLNSLINCINIYFKAAKSTDNEDNLIVVLDPMTDYFRVKKYQKHGYGINKLAEDSTVLVTNYDKDSLRRTVDFSNYGKVIIFDRYHQEKNAVRVTDSDIYYLIDSPTDIKDFNLDNNKCIAFFKEEDYSRFSINPNFDCIQYQDLDRAGMLSDNKLIERLCSNV